MKTKIALAAAAIAAGLCLTAPASPHSDATTPEVQLGRVVGAWVASLPGTRPAERTVVASKIAEAGTAVGKAVGSMLGSPGLARLGAA